MTIWDIYKDKAENPELDSILIASVITLITKVGVPDFILSIDSVMKQRQVILLLEEIRKVLGAGR